MRRVRVFTDKYPYLGPLVYVLSGQYFAVQLIVASAWMRIPYRWSSNVISDLGNTVCAPFSGRFVCSPLHALMNGSFIVLGAYMLLGSGLIYHEFKRSAGTFAGFMLMGLAGLGTVFVGVFPENTVPQLHGLGAALAFGAGNVSLVILALAITQARPLFRWYSAASGLISLAALGLYVIGNDLGLGLGTIERTISYPQALWLLLFGLYMSATRLRARRKPTT